MDFCGVERALVHHASMRFRSPVKGVHLRRTIGRHSRHLVTSETLIVFREVEDADYSTGGKTAQRVSLDLRIVLW